MRTRIILRTVYDEIWCEITEQQWNRFLLAQDRMLRRRPKINVDSTSTKSLHSQVRGNDSNGTEVESVQQGIIEQRAVAS